METTKYWYRFEDRLEGDERGSWTVLHLRKLIVIKETPKGVKLIGINHGRRNPRFVLLTARKQWACPTVEDARNSYLKRKERQIRIYKSRAANAEYAHDLAKLGEWTEGPDWTEWA